MSDGRGSGEGVEISWQVDGMTMSGTLARPPGAGSFPAVVMVAGSGPTDRDWTSPLLPGANGSARLLACYASCMIRVLITGMSGTGKSSVVAELRSRGYRAIDSDEDDWHEWVEFGGRLDWVWREQRMRRLLASDEPGLLFVSGTSPNQGLFYPRFDHVILLSAPTPVILERLTSRTNNPFGKSAEERSRILADIEAVEPLLRRGATAEISTEASLDRVVQLILDLVLP